MSTRQQPSEHGRILGTALAGIAESMVAEHPEIPDRCKTCAFRPGTIPNQMAGTLSEALNCVLGIDPAQFGCHHHLKDGEPTHLCSGYLLARAAPFDDVRAALRLALDGLDQLREEETR